MENNQRFLAVITARGGSKGVKNKNILPLNGKPLIAYTVEAASQLDEVNAIVSTDRLDIKRIVENHGGKVPFLRPAELSTDTASSYDTVRHAVEFYLAQNSHYDAVITLQPTSPLRTRDHLREAIALFNQHRPDSLVSVYEDPEVNYTKIYKEDGKYGASLSSDRGRRQDLAKTYIRNGAIYITSMDYFMENRLIYSDRPLLYPMAIQASIDINTRADWQKLLTMCEHK